jgi:hypothetical protein
MAASLGQARSAPLQLRQGGAVSNGGRTPFRPAAKGWRRRGIACGCVDPPVRLFGLGCGITRLSDKFL